MSWSLFPEYCGRVTELPACIHYTRSFHYHLCIIVINCWPIIGWDLDYFHWWQIIPSDDSDRFRCPNNSQVNDLACWHLQLSVGGGGGRRDVASAASAATEWDRTVLCTVLRQAGHILWQAALALRVTYCRIIVWHIHSFLALELFSELRVLVLFLRSRQFFGSNWDVKILVYQVCSL